MKVPEWNCEWEKPDPLRGRLGWERHHYATFGVSVVLLVTAFGLAIPDLLRARQDKINLNRDYLLQQATMVQAVERTLRPQ
jgi:hypothetical protein